MVKENELEKTDKNSELAKSKTYKKINKLILKFKFYVWLWKNNIRTDIDGKIIAIIETLLEQFQFLGNEDERKSLEKICQEFQEIKSSYEKLFPAKRSLRIDNLSEDKDELAKKYITVKQEINKIIPQIDDLIMIFDNDFKFRTVNVSNKKLSYVALMCAALIITVAPKTSTIINESPAIEQSMEDDDSTKTDRIVIKKIDLKGIDLDAEKTEKAVSTGEQKDISETEEKGNASFYNKRNDFMQDVDVRNREKEYPVVKQEGDVVKEVVGSTMYVIGAEYAKARNFAEEAVEAFKKGVEDNQK